jgi:hypothetical protein
MVSSKGKLEREGSEVNAPGQSSAKPAWPWVVVRLGYFLPCLIGIFVWFYLQVVGIPGFKPMPLGWILGVIPVLVIFSFLWVLPFVAVALAADRLPLAQTKYRGLVYGAFLGTALFEVLFFSDFWTNVEAIFMGFLVLPVVTFAGTLLGALFGLLVGRYFQPKKPT